MDQKKQLIMKHALHSFIERGIENTSVQDILEEANISRGTFYKFFVSKDACAAELISQIYSEIRNELEQKLIGRSIHDKKVLQQQFVMYLERMDSYHLYDLVRVIKQGQDNEMRKMVFHEEITYIRLMANRIVEVFGEEMRNYSYEAMILYNGLLQTIMIKQKVDQKPIDAEKTITITMRYLEKILQEMKQSKQSLFEYEESDDSMKKDKAALFKELKKVQKNLAEDDSELIEAIKEEIKREQPRKPVLHALTTSLSDSLQELKLTIESFI